MADKPESRTFEKDGLAIKTTVPAEANRLRSSGYREVVRKETPRETPRDVVKPFDASKK